MKRYIITVILFLSLLPMSASQAGEENDLFNSGLDRLEAGEYMPAYNIFLQLYESYQNSRNLDKYLYFKGKAGMYAEILSESRLSLERLAAAHPNSAYTPYGHFVLGNVNYKLNRPNQAVDNYIYAYNLSNDKRLTDLAVESLIGMVIDYGSLAVERILQTPVVSDRQCDLLIEIAQELVREGNFQPIKSILEPCPSTEAEELIASARNHILQKATIGAVLPVSGELRTYGEAILDGMTLRLEQFKEQSGKDISSIIYDTEGKTLEAARIVKRLSAEDVAAVIGPLTSEETSVASAVLACGDMPMIAPAASQAGLTELSSSCFQLTPNLDWQGVRMADLAIEYLGADTAAIITPTSPENLSMARAFADRFIDRGGKVLAIEYFRVRETDFGPFVKDIKSLVLGELLDSLIFLNEAGDTIEAEEVPVWIDCIYIPADPSQLKLLLPQIQFYNLKTALLGSDGWGHKSVYDLSDEVLGMHYFTSGRIMDDSRDQTRQFYFDFDKRFGRQPGRLEALGFDAMSLYCDAFSNGHYSREAIVRHLSTIKDYRGVAGDVSFGSNRENIDLPVYRIERGRPQKVELRLGQ